MATKKAIDAGATKVTQQGMMLLSQSDILKASFSGVSKIATTAIKAKSTALFGETDIDDFATFLRVSFHAGATSLNSALGEVSNATLLLAWAAYDVAFTNENVYKAALQELFDRYRAQIRRIGTEQQVSRVLYSRVDTRAYWIDAYGKTRLALLLDQKRGNFPYVRQVRTFDRWISDDLVDLAVAATQQRFGKVEKIDPAKIAGHIPDPDTGK
jgi:hypothetical protein